MKTTKYQPSAEEKLKKDAGLFSINTFLEDYQAQLGDGSRPYRGLETGYTDIDKMIQGLDRFVLLSGRSGAGKTTLAIQLAMGVVYTRYLENEARKANGEEPLPDIPLIVYSLEMPRNEIITKLVQCAAHELGYDDLLAGTDDIVLAGNNPDLPKDKKDALSASIEFLDKKIGDCLYVRDSRLGVPRILDGINEYSASNDNRGGSGFTEKSTKHISQKSSTSSEVAKIPKPSMYRDILDLKSKHHADDVLVLIDSIQDIVVNGDSDNTVQNEVDTLAEIDTLQNLTNATIFATAQKSKAASNGVGYGGIKGSINYQYKPNTIIQLTTLEEMLPPASAQSAEAKAWRAEVKRMMIDAANGYPAFVQLEVTKCRYGNSNGRIGLDYHGKYGYFESRESRDDMDLLNEYNDANMLIESEVGSESRARKR